MKSTFLSRFTPSLMPQAALEAIFVQREREARRTVELVRESVLTAGKSHTLFVGPRGIGKTHLVSLIYHRLRAQEDLADRLLIAWLREEEWGVSSFLDVLQRILRALAEDDPALAPRLAAVQAAGTETAAERVAKDLLREIVGPRTLLLLAENLDDLFDGIGDEGQKRFRAFLQDTRFTTILATSQGLFSGVSRQASPFYNFFRVQHLPGLSLDEAVLLLTKIAELEEDTALASFLHTPAGRARVRAVHHLAGGSPRVYVIFSEFLTRDALDELVAPFLKMLDELTPYYQSKMRSLSPQQRKIVEILSDARGAIPVKEIAARSFLTHQTVSSQLQELREKGYAMAHKVGRESFYELQEPLMRLCLEVKKQRGEPITLFVDFLRLWCTREDLERRLSLLPADAMLTKWHLREALRLSEGVEDPRVAACLRDWKTFYIQGDYEKALQVAEELITIRGQAFDWFTRGSSFVALSRYREALEDYEQALKLGPEDAANWFNRGLALGHLGRDEEALTCFEGGLRLAPNDAPAWFSKGISLISLNRHEEALVAFEQASNLDAGNAAYWFKRGFVLSRMGRNEEVLACCEQGITLDPKNTETWVNKGTALSHLNRHAEALAAYEQALTLNSSDADAWWGKALALYNQKLYGEALKAFDHTISLNNGAAAVCLQRALTLLKLNQWDETIKHLSELSSRFLEEPEMLSIFSTEAVHHLLAGNQSQWQVRAETLTTLYGQHGSGLVLGQALTTNLPYVTSPLLSPAARQLWLETWQKAAGEVAEMRLPLRLLDAAIRYHDSGDPPNPRILLELPVEERSILESLLGVSQSSDAA